MMQTNEPQEVGEPDPVRSSHWSTMTASTCWPPTCVRGIWCGWKACR